MQKRVTFLKIRFLFSVSFFISPDVQIVLRIAMNEPHRQLCG
jgi:hypothetical protein